MDILNLANDLKKKARNYGRYRFVSEKSGVGYQWLTKFAIGKSENPGIVNIHKLKKFFDEYDRNNDF